MTLEQFKNVVKLFFEVYTLFEPRYGELESDALACPRGAVEPLFVEIHRPFETLEFREPYRGVQSCGDKWAFRRIMSAPCREGVRSSNEKSLPLSGLIAHKLTRRICGFGQGGGARGTGVEPSPRRPTQSSHSGGRIEREIDLASVLQQDVLQSISWIQQSSTV